MEAFDESLLSYSQQERLNQIACQLTAKGKGILALDETEGVCNERLSMFGMENTEEFRRQYRQLFISASPMVAPYISGYSLQDEAFNQRDDDAMSFAKLLTIDGILPGVRLDGKLIRVPGTICEYCTQGLDDLHDKCAFFYRQLARFGKWRCVYKITESTPSSQLLSINSSTLARFAAICQQNGLVPMVQIDLLSEGSHPLHKTKTVTETILSHLFRALQEHRVYLSGLLLHTNMVTPGIDCGIRYSHEQISLATLDAMRNCVPPSVPGIFFGTGDQVDMEATLRLNGMNNAPLHRPWAMTFGFARALEFPVLNVWQGILQNAQRAKGEFVSVAKLNSVASQGMVLQSNPSGEGSSYPFQAYHTL